MNRKHFVRLHNEGQTHSGIIACTYDLDFIGQALRIHTALQELPDVSGQVVRVNRPA